MSTTTEAGVRPAPILEISERRTEVPSYQPLPGFQARLAFGGRALDKSETDFGEVTDNSMEIKDWNAFRAASNKEREEYWKEKAGDRYSQWNNSFKKSFTSKMAFFKSEEGQSWADVMSKLGLHPANLTDEQIKAFYNQYFNGSQKQSQVEVFVQDILDSYTEDGKLDVAKIQEALPAIQWIGKVFGENSSEAIAQLVDTQVKLSSSEGKRELKAHLHDTIKPDSQEEQLLVFLQPHVTIRDKDRSQNGGAPQVESIEELAVEAGGDEEQAFQPEAEMPLEERFAHVKGNVDKTNPYFIEEPRRHINLSDEHKNLEILKPFFVDIEYNEGRASWRLNKEVAPFVFQIGDGGSHDPRFLNAEKSTHNDSGLFALAAASAESPAKQAILYRELAENILDIHLNNPNLLSKWLEIQSEGGEVTPLHILMHNDIDPSTGQLRPENERLLLGDNGSIMEDFSKHWGLRIGELTRVLIWDRLQTNDLRWIEFLSHSVNVEKMMGLMKQRSSEASSSTDEPPIQLDEVRRGRGSKNGSEPGQSGQAQASQINPEAEAARLEPRIQVVEITNPNNLTEQINRRLAETTGEQQFLFDPQTLVNFVKSLDLPGGLNVKKLSAHIQKGNVPHLVLKGDIGRSLGGARFDLALRNNRTNDGVTVEHMHLDPYKGGRGKREEIEQKLREINSLLRQGISTQIPSNWEVAGFHILEDTDKIALNVREKST